MLKAVGIVTDIQTGDPGADSEVHAVGLEKCCQALADRLGTGDGVAGGDAWQDHQKLKIGHPVIGIEVTDLGVQVATNARKYRAYVFVGIIVAEVGVQSDHDNGHVRTFPLAALDFLVQISGKIFPAGSLGKFIGPTQRGQLPGFVVAKEDQQRREQHGEQKSADHLVAVGKANGPLCRDHRQNSDQQRHQYSGAGGTSAKAASGSA